jgi:hypothetical protein
MFCDKEVKVQEVLEMNGRDAAYPCSWWLPPCGRVFPFFSINSTDAAARATARIDSSNGMQRQANIVKAWDV